MIGFNQIFENRSLIGNLNKLREGKGREGGLGNAGIREGRGEGLEKGQKRKAPFFLRMPCRDLGLWLASYNYQHLPALFHMMATQEHITLINFIHRSPGQPCLSAIHAQVRTLEAGLLPSLGLDLWRRKHLVQSAHMDHCWPARGQVLGGLRPLTARQSLLLMIEVFQRNEEEYKGWRIVVHEAADEDCSPCCHSAVAKMRRSWGFLAHVYS